MQPTVWQSKILNPLILNQGRLYISLPILVCWVFLFFSGCDYPRRDFPDLIEVFTVNIDSVGLTQATALGKITGDERAGLLMAGHCWSKDQTLPTLDDSHTTIPAAALQTDFQSKMTGLSPQTNYFVRGYLIVDAGGKQEIVYESSVKSFKTSIFDLNTINFLFEGQKVKVTSLLSGLSGDTVSAYGHCWSDQNPLPEITSSAYSNFGTITQDTAFEEYITGLIIGATYYIRAYAVFKNDTAYSEVRSIVVGNYWVQRKDCPDEDLQYFLAGFCLHNKIYVVCENRWWRYNPDDDTWTQITNPPFYPFSATAFTIGNAAYVVSNGYDSLGVFGISVFSYDTLNMWVEKASWPMQTADPNVSFAIDSTGYVYTGYDSEIKAYLRELWAYYPSDTTNGYDIAGRPNGRWVRKTDFPGQPRINATSFSIGRRGYVGLGEAYNSNSVHTVFNDFWEYDPDDLSNGLDETNEPKGAWKPIKNIGDYGRSSAFGFSIGGYGYVGGGDNFNTIDNVFFTDLLRYNPQTREWSAMAPFPDGIIHVRAVAVSTPGSALLTPGSFGSNNYKKFWEYIPSF